jgi:hypothetical protein
MDEHCGLPPAPPPNPKKYIAGLWRAGCFTSSSESFDVGLRKDGSKELDCFSIVFGGEHTDANRNSSDVGFLLVERQEGGFALRGMKVASGARGRGLSKTFLALWLKLCLEVGVSPVTRKQPSFF